MNSFFHKYVSQKATLGEFEVQLYDLVLLKELIGWFLPRMQRWMDDGMDPCREPV